MSEREGGPAAPLILTLGLDAVSFERLDTLRRMHFPPERNWLSAHLTLFHKLPGESVEEITADLRAAADRAPIALTVEAPMLLARGVAFRVQAPELIALRAELAERWSAWLTPQDRQPLRPHVTVQNKVKPEAAKSLHAELSVGFEAWSGAGEALLLWRYLGGPWERVERFSFRTLSPLAGGEGRVRGVGWRWAGGRRSRGPAAGRPPS